jgi:hypothetical protein
MPVDRLGADADTPQGLSWTWELDFDALTRCLGDDRSLAARPAASPAAGPAASSAPGPAGSPAPGPAGSSAPGPAGSSAPGPAGSSDAGQPGVPVAGRPGVPVAGPERFPGAGLEDEEAAQEAVLAAVAEHGGERIPTGALTGLVAGYLPPGPDLAAWLAMAPAADLKDRDLASVAGAWRRVASWAQAQELAAVAQIASRAAARDDDIGTDANGRPARVPAAAAAEVSLELTMSQFGASWWTDLAVDLAWRLAATGAALAAGVIDLSRARLIAEATRLLSDPVARAVEEKVLPAAGDLTTGMLRAALRRAVIAADPEGAEQRRKQTERQAKVSLYPDEECTATLAGQRLPSVHAAAAMARISAMARALKASGAAGGMDLLRAQIYLGLLLGTLPLIPPAEGAPPDDGPPSGPGSRDDSGQGPGNGPGHDSGNGPGRGPRDGTGGEDHGLPGGNSPGAGDDPGLDGCGPAMGDWPRQDDAVPGDVPPLGDQNAPLDDCPCPDDAPAGSDWDGPGQDDYDDGRPAGNWPEVPTASPLAAHPVGRQAASGMLDVSMPWRTLAGISPEPGHLGRIGPVTAVQARRLAELAASNPAADWRIVVTNSSGQAIAVTRIRRTRMRSSPAAPPGPGAGLVSRITLAIPEDLLAHPPPGPGRPGGPGLLGAILARALQAARDVAARARAGAGADAAAGGCAHGSASPAYRPPPRLREYIVARDLTCRSPTCRQPAWRGDLDHTIPYDKGGLTCRCNLGGVCRTHHLIKQHPGWSLWQTAPGSFAWATPAGRIFTATPDVHAI